MDRITNLKKILGFTLIELIIVIAIISLLAGIVVVIIQPQNIFASARNSQRSNDLNTLQSSLNRYLADSSINVLSRSLNDLGGYVGLYNNAVNAVSGICNNGSIGQNIPSTGAYNIDISGFNVFNISTLINLGYLTKLLKDPSGNNYQACIDVANNNKLVIYAPVIESINAIYQVIGQFDPLKGGLTPQQIPNLFLWLKADSFTNISDNTPISNWIDLSGNNNSATPLFASNDPIYKSNIINSKPSLSFDGLNNFLISPISNLTKFHIFAVLQEPSSASTTYACVLGNENYTNYGFIFGSVNPNAYLRYSQTDNSTTTPNSSFASFPNVNSSASTNHILSLSRDNLGNVLITNNGSTTSTTAIQPGNFTNLAIGASNTGGGALFKGYISEILIYSDALSNTDRLKVENYLDQKYSVY